MTTRRPQAPPRAAPGAPSRTSPSPTRGARSTGTSTCSAPRSQGEPIVMPDGRIGHAELELAGGMLYLADEHPEIGVARAAAGGVVGEPDAAGATTPTRSGPARWPPAPAATGRRTTATATRNAWIVDPFGHRWGLQLTAAVDGPAEQPQLPPGRRRLCVAVTSPTRPARRTSTPPCSAGRTPTSNGPGSTGATPSTGIWETDEPPTLFCAYAVDDVARPWPPRARGGRQRRRAGPAAVGADGRLRRRPGHRVRPLRAARRARTGEAAAAERPACAATCPTSP